MHNVTLYKVAFCTKKIFYNTTNKKKYRNIIIEYISIKVLSIKLFLSVQGCISTDQTFNLVKPVCIYPLQIMGGFQSVIRYNWGCLCYYSQWKVFQSVIMHNVVVPKASYCTTKSVFVTTHQGKYRNISIAYISIKVLWINLLMSL